MADCKLLFDIGGTNTRVGISFDGKTIDAFEKFPTSQKFWEGIDHITEVSKKLLGDHKLTMAVGGIAGPLNTDKTMSINPPNLPEWKQHPLKEELEKALNTTVYLENDTALAGLGEALEGAGRNYSIVAYITVSTGINGVRIVDKKIEKSATGFEIGHQIIDFDNSVIQTSSGRGELEDFISGREIEKRYGRYPGQIDDPDVWRVISEYTAIGIHNTLMYWSPDVVVLGGGVANKISIPTIKDKLTKITTIFNVLPPMVYGELEDRAALLGALNLI